ncbi:MAG TPA: hypothetical protein VE715_14790 [Blastocatellia bacterium]|nr:hypothetical protein [Blastocatellia bacterium]
MDQTESIEITNGTLVLDEPTLNAAHIKNKARIVVRENSILILPAEPESQPAGDVIAEWFGSFHLPPEAARYLAEDKEIEYDI